MEDEKAQEFSWKTILGIIAVLSFVNAGLTSWISFYSDNQTDQTVSQYEIRNIQRHLTAVEKDIERLDKAVSSNTRFSSTFTLELSYIKSDVTEMSKKIDVIYQRLVENK